MVSVSTKMRAVVAALVLTVSLLAAGGAESAQPVDEVRLAVQSMNQWLQRAENGPGWQEYLDVESLEAQLADPQSADPSVVAGIVRRFASAGSEADRPQFLRVRRALETWLAEMPPVSLDQLPTEIEAAKEAFIPRTSVDAAAARRRLVEALGRLGNVLNPANAESARWRQFLRWDELQEQLGQREEQPDLRVLDEVYARYASGHNGLDLRPFDDVRVALREYLVTSRAMDDGSLESQYKELLDALPEALEKYRQDPAPGAAASLVSAIRWLSEAGQASWIAETIQRNLTRPNFFARFDGDVLTSAMNREVDEVGPVTDVILGASVRGTSHTTGRVTAELVPSETKGRIDNVFLGTIVSNTVGYKSPAQVRSRGVTAIGTRKPILITKEGFSTMPASSLATTRSTTLGVSVDGGPRVQQAARDQVYSQKRQAERISAQHAEARANRRADDQAAEGLAESQESYVTKFRDPLSQRKLFPKRFDFSTTTDAIHLTGLQAGPYDLGAPAAPPAMPGDHLALVVHESAINNLAAGALSGRVLTEAEFRTTLEQMLGEVPDRFKESEEQEPWTITFADVQPLTVRFADGQIEITIRGQQYVTGETSYSGMDVAAVYKVVQDGGVVKAVRQGELAIFPPGFTPDAGEQLSVRQQSLRRMLERQFGKIFDAEIVPEPIELPGQWAKTGKFGLDRWETGDGWMTMAWNRLPGSQTEQVSSR